MEFLGTPLKLTQLLSSFTKTTAVTTGNVYGPARYTLPLDYGDCLQLLKASYCSEVIRRGCEPRNTERLELCLQDVAHILVVPAPKWGMIFLSDPGCGKTTMVRAIQQVLNKLKVKDVLARPNEFIRQGLGMFNARTLNDYYEQDKSYFQEIANKSMLAIDDLGVESKGKMIYGQAYFPVNELIEYRYSRQLYTVITTNLEKSELVNTYGARFFDRLTEMCHRVNFGNRYNSFRQSNDKMDKQKNLNEPAYADN